MAQHDGDGLLALRGDFDRPEESGHRTGVRRVRRVGFAFLNHVGPVHPAARAEEPPRRVSIRSIGNDMDAKAGP
ncbi:MAG: hypothetical protein IPN23_11245 [Elusimicrobia bacterium]|nr:hypothetical protein [Elusimicrobiota bacterium]